MKSFKVLFCLLFLFGVLNLYAAPRQEAPVSAPATRLFTDSAGRTVKLPQNIRRIVPSGALALMFLQAIAPDMICAIPSAFTAEQGEFIPQSLQKLPIVGQFYGAANLNPEEIAAIGPDIIIDVGEPKDTIAQDMDSISASIAIPTVHITATLESTPEAFRMLGVLLDRQAQGNALADFSQRTLDSAQGIMNRVGNNKKAVLYCLGKGGTNVLAAGSFHAEILDWMTNNQAKVDNPASRGSGNETDLEQISLWNPEIILFGADSVYAQAASDPAWKQLRAIKNGAYYEVPQGPYNWMGSPPSINRYLGMLWLGTILYPEYVQYDLYTEAAEYYKLFYGYTLSQERFNRIMVNSIHGK
ncbi:ABC transporter substrate-binding protein [Leadbettera azotonutricia]|uniref:Periplasmic binding protein n=1 Tax=Leadbettera azotonutricia (strain ATCC BAA-888 / DSM 13862 / ZAS-9) TaxID=545695 RepID=F5YEP6_LEAAZ|nr:ABC transporter substrate-binding protein [Leadbettera azotonutricia]AEF81750.1 periplasmic binding protein [Leadbettera azotonutricia ZAS-9]